MLDDFLEGLTARWQEFLEWSDEKGLPLRGASDALEQNGIPPAPFFLGLLIVAVCAIGYIAYSNLGPATGTITINVRDLTGVEIAGADVSITNLADRAVSFQNLSDSDGVAVFAHVPLGAYNVSVSSANYKGKFSTVDISESTTRAQTLKLEELPLNANATVAVYVDGVAGAVIPAVSVKNSLLSVVGTKQGAKVTFSLPKSSAYTIIANAEGYTQNSTTISVGSEDPAPVSIYLYPVADEKNIDVTVQLSATAANASFSGATIQVLTATGLLLRSLNADADGKATVKLAKGGKFRFIASLDGYDEAVLDYTADPAFKSVKIALSKPGSDGAVKTTCTVVDEAGSKAGVATVSLYLNDEKKSTAKTAADGIASFSLLPTESYWVTAYKSKYLPVGMALTAGGECKLVLAASTKENVAKVKVKVTDEADGLISGASVALFGADGALGLPESTTGSDGAADFSDVPLESVYAYAASNGRTGYSSSKEITIAGEDGKNYTTLTARLLPQQGTLKFRVIDRFSRQAITGAVVDAATTDSASCTTITGTCSVDVLEGWGYFKVAAPGYSSYSSAQVQVVPNIEKEVQVELLSSSIAENVKAVFLGLYDLSGNRVSSLEPSTTYNAKFLINAPDIKFTKAALHVRLGTTTGDASAQNAFISGFDGGTDASTSGGDSYGVSSTVANASALSSTEAAYDSVSGSMEYKWAELSYPSFAGTKEAYVQITTRQAKNGTVLFGFRTAYSTANGTLRDPSDDGVKAGQEQLAAVNVTKYAISFGGVCSESQCLEAKVSTTRGEYSKNFEATIPEEFTLTVKSIAQNGPYDLRVTSSSNKTLRILSGSSPSGAATITNEEDGQLALVSVPSGNVDATFTIKALRVSDAATFTIEADYEGEKVNGLELAGRIIAASNNELTVGVSPAYVSALADNAVTFLITDAFGTPIEDAHVEVGSKTDVFGDSTYDMDGSGDENEGKDGKYLLEGINPEGIGSADFTVTATGYAQFYGSIPVTAKKMVEISPTEALDLLVDSKEGNSDSISVSNLLENDIKVRASVVLDKSPRITGTLLSESDFTLEAGASQEIKFDTWILESVLDVAKSTRTLSENFSGRITIEARAGSSRQSVKIPFKVYSAFVQQPLGEFWGTQEDSAELTLYLGSDNESTANLHVFNTLSNNLLVNYQLDSANDWLSFSPASLVLGPSDGEAGQVVFAGEEEAAAQDNVKNLTLIANVPSNRKTLCVMENNGQVTTNLTLVASINGIRSERKIPVILNLQSDVDCVPDNAVDVVMPLGMKVSLSAKTLKKENEDGSIAVQEPSKDTTRVVFSGASLSDSKTAPYVTAPSGSTISASPAMAVIIKPQEEFTLALPYVATYYLDTYFERANNADGSTAFTLDSGDIVTFPAGTTIGVSTASLLQSKPSTGLVSAKFADSESTSTTQVGVTAKVLANAAVNFKTEGSSAACTSAVELPKSGTISLPAGAQITTSPSGAKEAAFPDCSSLEVETEDGSVLSLPAANKLVLADGSEISRDGQVQTASVPRRSEMQVSYCSQSAKDSYSATFGEDVSFQFSENKTITGGTIKFGSCQQIVTANGYTLPPATAISFDDSTEVVTDSDGNTAVNLYAGNKVTFASCACTDAKSGKVKLSTGVTATTGSALTVKPSKIEFTLTDGALTASDKTVCVSNSATQSLNVSAKATNIPDSIITSDDIFFGGEYSHSGVIATSKINTCSALTINANVPKKYLDSYGCIASKTSVVKEGKIKLTARTLSGVDVSEANLPEISVKVTIKAGKCEARDMGLSDNYLKDVFVNYDSTITDVKTNQKMVFAFKNGGHSRPLLIVNNRPNDVSLSFKSSDSSVVNCASVPATVKRSDAIMVNCDSVVGSGSATGKQATLTFTFTDGAETVTKTVRAIVYSTDATALYSSSPMGDMLPLERAAVKNVKAATTATAAGADGETASFADTADSSKTGTDASKTTSTDKAATTGASSTTSSTSTTTATATPVVSDAVADANYGVTSTADCTTHFCTYDQSVAAYTKFVGSMRQVVDYIGKDDEGLGKRMDLVCPKSAGTGNAYSKTMVMQVVNMKQTFDFLNSVAQEQFGTVTNTAGMPAFDGCGVYKITAKPQICITQFTNAQDYKSNVAIDIAAERVGGGTCPETLANAMLLMGNDQELIVGDNFTEGPGEIKRAFDKALKFDFFGSFRIGVYRNEPNLVDTKTADLLLQSGYGWQLRVDESNSRTIRWATLYDDNAYCFDKGKTILGETVAATYGLDALLIASGVGTAQAVQTLAGGITTTAAQLIIDLPRYNVENVACVMMSNVMTNALSSQGGLIAPGVITVGTNKGAAIEELTRLLVGSGYGKGLTKDAAVEFIKYQKVTIGAAIVGAGANYAVGGSGGPSAVTKVTAVGIMSQSAYTALFNERSVAARLLVTKGYARDLTVAEKILNGLTGTGPTKLVFTSTKMPVGAGITLLDALVSAPYVQKTKAYTALLNDMPTYKNKLYYLQQLRTELSPKGLASSDLLKAITKAENAASSKAAVQTAALVDVADELAKVTKTEATTIIYDVAKTTVGETPLKTVLTSKAVGLVETAADTVTTTPAISTILATNLESAAVEDLSLPGKIAKNLETELIGKGYTQPEFDKVIKSFSAKDYQKAFEELDALGQGQLGQTVLSDANVIGKVDIAKLPQEAVIKDIVAKSTADDLITTPKVSTLLAQNKWTIARSVASVASMALIMLMMDCDFRPAQAVLNPEMLNHFVVFSQKSGDLVIPGAFDEPSMYRACFAENGLSESEVIPAVKSDTCLVFDTDFCPTYQYSSSQKSLFKPSCVGLARSGKIDNLNGYTLFLGIKKTESAKDNLKFISSLFDSTVKPIDTKNYLVYRRSSQIDAGLVGYLVGDKPNGSFTFLSG